MSVAQAEQPPIEFCRPNLGIVPDDSRDDLPRAIFVPGLITEQFDRKRAERLIRHAGEVALVGATMEEKKSERQTFTSLHDAIHAAKEGNQRAKDMVKMNVSTDRFERTKKVQFIMSVELEANEDREIMQHGQTNEQIQANTLYHCADNSKMFPRYGSETRNMLRLGTALKEGRLDDYWFFVSSPCADDMIDEELDDQGFFSFTKSMALQATTMHDGKIIMESAFVAGVRSEDEERHDFETLQKMGDLFGVDLTGTASDIIDKPLLIPKSLMPNGIVDIVKLYDDLAGGTFFGEDKPRQDYLEFVELCNKEREEAEQQVDEMVDKLLSRANEATDPVAASILLDDVVGTFMAGVAVEDETIDPRVFGLESAWYITDARSHLAMGDYQRAQLMTRRAVEAERSSSCPGGAKRRRGGDDPVADLIDPYSTESEVNVNREEDKGDCDFVSKECPLCHAKNVKTTVRSGVYYGECGCDSKHGKRKSGHDTPISTKKPIVTPISLAKKKHSKASGKLWKQELAAA